MCIIYGPEVLERLRRQKDSWEAVDNYYRDLARQMENHEPRVYPKVWHRCEAFGVVISAWVNPGICPYCSKEVKDD